MLLTVVIPVFNEHKTILEVIQAVLDTPFDKEVVVVDDGSTDGTREALATVTDPRVRVLLHEKNKGKGAALRTAFKEARGELVLIQDADLEYHPSDFEVLLRPMLLGRADVVYGSRFKGSGRAFMFLHYVANRSLTLLTNILYNSILSDMETGYKVFRREFLQSIEIKSNRFNFEPEITAKVLKRGARLVEVPIQYYGRGYDEGKKIGIKDAFEALWALIKYRFVD